jgi:hypothetical protein
MSDLRKEGLPTEKIILSVEAIVTIDPEYLSGNMHLTFQDCSAEVRQGLSGREGKPELIGEIVGCLGGGVEINDKKSGKTYYISAGALWEAFENWIRKNDSTGHDSVCPICGQHVWTPSGKKIKFCMDSTHTFEEV